MAMLEAFVHDPLINWRLLKPSEAGGSCMLLLVERSSTVGGGSVGGRERGSEGAREGRRESVRVGARKGGKGRE
jgi:phosphatidylinositol kinase/protein kinase (PI-3  family)